MRFIFLCVCARFKPSYTQPAKIGIFQTISNRESLLKPIIVYPAWDKPLFRDKSARDMTSAQILCG